MFMLRVAGLYIERIPKEPDRLYVPRSMKHTGVIYLSPYNCNKGLLPWLQKSTKSIEQNKVCFVLFLLIRNSRVCVKQQRCSCVSLRGTVTDRLQTPSCCEQWGGMEPLWGPHLTTPVIILIFNQDGILHSFPCSAWGSHAWEIEQPAKGGVRGETGGCVWTEREQSMSACFPAHKPAGAALAFLLQVWIRTPQ